MGAKDSKLSVISFEDASKRVTEAESARLRETFRRVTAVNSTMSDTVFVREVLWDGVPPNIAQLIYRGYGGTSKGLSYKDLLCGLVVLTKGTREEKLKLIFGMYCDDNGTFVQKSEMDKRVLETEGQVSPALCALFRESDQVSFEAFSYWLRVHPDATIISKWLLTESSSLSLSGEHDTPTFYQTLAGVTHLEEREIIELEKRYWNLKAMSKIGKFDVDLFRSQVCPPVPEKLCESLFLAFDENCDNHIDFKEMACGISACCRGPTLERQKFCFKVFDQDHDNRLNEQEVTAMLEALNIVRKEYNSVATLESQNFPPIDPTTVTKEILSCHDINKDGFLTMEDYLMWTVNNQLTTDFLQLLSQICHIVLGLSPQTKEEEGKIIQHWLERESRKPLEVGQVWYLVNMAWWNAWLDYVNAEVGDANSHSHSRITKGKHLGSSLAWEDESVIMVGASKAGGDSHANRSNVNFHPVDSFPSHRGSPSMSPKNTHKNVVTTPTRPPAINNNSLLINPTKYISMTNEGGRLRRDAFLLRGKDFEIVPESIWRAFTTWYGGNPALPRTVINFSGKPELELYPIGVRLMRHQMPSQRPPPATSFTGMVAGIGGMAWNFAASPNQPRRYHAHTASFSRKHSMAQIYEFLCNKLRFYREDFRLWKINSKDDQNLTLLEDETKTVEDYGIEDMQQLLLEVRNKDLTWPEEMSQLAKNKHLKKDDLVPTQKGATGLNNLGNTCFMNAAVQCVSNTWPLTQYFAGNLHLFELNRDNPLGMKGHIAQRYGELVKDLWSGTSRTIAPLKLRWTIGKYAPRFNGFQQHDSQELLSFLLDGLHEDLNRVHNKPYVTLKDSDGRPDQIVAREAWENHLLRNQSIVVDLFHGQLMSQVRCKECGHVSVRFDPYSHLSLPLPMDSCIHLEVIVHKLDGSVPVKYGLRLNMDEKYRTLKREVSQLSNIPEEELLIVEVNGPIVKSLPRDEQKIRSLQVPGSLFLYQLPPPPLIQPLTDEEEREGDSQAMSDSQESLEAQGQEVNPAMSAKFHNSPKINGQIPQMSLSSGNQGPPVVGTRSPVHSRSPSNASTVNAGSLEGSKASDKFENFVIGVHRKMNLMDVYFLSSQKSRPSLFGTPIIIPRCDTSTNQDIYQFVWTQISRLVSPLPASESKMANHAQDCDDSLGYEYPFLLKEVQKDGFLCAKCPWYKFCRGCKVECNSSLYGNGSSFLAIDWEATALHLRYQISQEKFYEEHPSVAQSRHKQTEPIDLDTCLQAFTKWEELDEDELYYCSKCKKHCLAAKKLDIWQLPPILIINLKRFQYLNGRWVKSHKIVNFPLRDFDPSAYLAQRDSATVTEDSTHSIEPVPNSEPASSAISPSSQDQPTSNPATSSLASVASSSTGCEVAETSFSKQSAKSSPAHPQESGSSLTPSALITKQLANGSTRIGVGPLTMEDRLRNFESADYSNVRYNLYALSCHTGILGGGHYVAYAKNTNDAWYCYNDSSCKEISESLLDKNSAYILFYERDGVDFSQYMPDTTGCEPDLTEIEDEFESDFKKMCVLQ